MNLEYRGVIRTNTSRGVEKKPIADPLRLVQVSPAKAVGWHAKEADAAFVNENFIDQLEKCIVQFGPRGKECLAAEDKNRR